MSSSRKLLRLLIPPIAYQFRTLRHRPFWKHTWQCVGETFESVAKGDGYRTPFWVQAQREFTEDLLRRAGRGGSVPRHVQGHRNLLPFAASLLTGDPGRPFTILDFGGAMGVDFIHLTSGLADSGAVRYIVVDTPESCRIGSELFAGDRRISFHSEIPDVRPEIAYLNAAIQYVSDWRGTLGRLAGLKPTLLLLIRTDAGDVPTHVRGQNGVHGSLIPCWCLNVPEVVSHMQALGYRLIFKGAGDAEYDESNLPESHRIGGPAHLVFRRADG